MATYTIHLVITFQNNGVAGAAENALNNLMSSRGPRGRPERCTRSGREVTLTLTGLGHEEAIELESAITPVWGAHVVTGGMASIWRDDG